MYTAKGSFTEDIARVGETGYTLFANKASSGPGADAGSVKRRGKGLPATENLWSQPVPLRPLAMVAGREHLCVVGVEDKSGEQDYWKYLEGRAGGVLAVHSILLNPLAHFQSLLEHGYQLGAFYPC